VLSSYERRRFNEIVSGLLAEDPAFGTSSETQLRPRPLAAVLLWLSMPFLVALGGWTGLLMAVVAGGYGAHLRFRGRFLRHGPPRSR
jgi:hypothetical protein